MISNKLTIERLLNHLFNVVFSIHNPKLKFLGCDKYEANKGNHHQVYTIDYYSNLVP